MAFNHHRILRFIAASLMLLMIGLLVSISGDTADPQISEKIGLYLGFLLLMSMGLMWLAGRLFRQHELKQLKFDVASLLVITTMIALPLGVGSLIANPPLQGTAFNAPANLPAEKTFVIVLLYATWIPLPFFTEACLSWMMRIRNLQTNGPSSST